MKSGYVVVALICVVFISIPQFSACQSKPLRVAQQDGSSSEDIARAQAELDQLVRKYHEGLARLKSANNLPAVAQLTNELGMIYYHYGRYEQAAQWFEKALNLAREIDDLGTRLNALINLGLVSMNTGKYEKAIETYEKVLDLSQGVDDLGLAAMVNHNLGLLYFQWGKPGKAVEFYEKSIALRREKGDKKWVAITLQNLGDVHSYMGKLDKALKAFEKSLSILQVGHTKEIKIGRAGALQRLAMIYTAKGEYSDAVKNLEQCLALAKEFNDLKMQAGALALLANVSYYRGQYKEAVHHGKESLKLKKELNDQRGVAAALGNLGILYSSIGEYGQATEYFQKALKVAEDVHDDRERSGALLNLGTVCANRGQYKEAIDHFRQALGLCKATQYAEGAAVVCSNLGRVYHDQGQYDKATEQYEAASSFYKSQGMENKRATMLLNLGRIREADGDPKAALIEYGKGLKILKELKVPTNWPHKLIGDVYLDMGQLQKAEQYLNKARADSSLGRLCLRKSGYDQAKVFYRKILETGEKNRNADALFTANTGLGLACEGLGQLEQASGHFFKATQYTEQLRSSLIQSERERFLEVRVGGFSRTTPYEGLARVLVKMNKPLDALKNSEFTKARVFAESMARRTQSSARGVPDNVLKRDTLLNDQRAAQTKNLEAAYEKQNKDAINNLESQKKDLNAKFDTHIGELRKKYPLFAATKYPEPTDLSQTALHDDEWVLSYDVTDPGILIYLTHGKKLVRSVFKPVPRKEVDDLVRKFRKPLELGPNDNKLQKLKAFDFSSGKKLSNLLLGDILTDLPKGTPLIVIPDDSLGVLSFEMLVLNKGGKIVKGKKGPYTKGADFFGDRNPISYNQSVTALTLARTLVRHGKGGTKLLVMADPVFRMGDKRAPRVPATQIEGAEARRHQNPVASVEDKKSELKGLKRLPVTADLAKDLKRIYPGEAYVMEGMDATKEHFLKTIVSGMDQYDKIVFATHGYFGGQLPGIREPVLVFTLVPPGTDGYLRMTEVMNLKMNADVVALTACQTGLGKRLSGEGTMCMGRAFMQAGAKCVLMSLWNVSELASVNLVDVFFLHLKRGKTKQEALRVARHAIRQAGYNHPYYWSSFILVGEVD